MEPGMQLDQNTLIEVLQNKLAQSAIRETQLEAGVQQLMVQNQQLIAQVEALRAEQETTAEAEIDLGPPDFEVQTLEPTNG